MPTYEKGSLTAVPFYSKTKSFVKLMHVSGSILCDKDASVHVQYTIQGEELKNGQESLEFFYLVSFCVGLRSNVSDCNPHLVILMCVDSGNRSC